MKCGLDIGGFQKSSRACLGLTGWLCVLVTRVLPLPGPRAVLPSDVRCGRSHWAVRGRRTFPAHPAPGRAPAGPAPWWRGPARQGLGFSASVRGAGLAGRGPRWEGGRERPVGLPSAPEKAPSPFFRVAWAHGGGVASGVANVHEHPEARERWLAVQRLAVTLSDREVPVVN